MAAAAFLPGERLAEISIEHAGLRAGISVLLVGTEGTRVWLDVFTLLQASSLVAEAMAGDRVDFGPVVDSHLVVPS